MKDSDSSIQADNKNNDSGSSAYQHIFLLSHMRANTSLISHILGSHPQISGYYEMHLNYRTDKDLLKQQQILLLNKELHKKINAASNHYLFDKILHNDYQLLLENLSSEPCSEKMKKGRIIKHQTNYEEIKIPSHLVHKAVTETSQYRQRIIAHAIDSITL